MIRATFILVLVVAVSSTPRNVRTDTRIINGQFASDGEFPWQVSLQEPYGSGYWHFCGGSIISQNYIMTAAHCQKPASTTVTVYAGSVDKFNGGTRLDTSNFLAHPLYNPDEISMDYGIIKLASTLTLTAKINTIAIPGSSYGSTSEFTGTATTSGWGYSEYYGSGNSNNELPLLLQKAQIPVLSDAECNEAWGSFYRSTSMICAGGEGTLLTQDEFSSVCMGDSGGPLVQDINGVTTLIGATSWAPSSCTSRLPSGWAKLSTVRDWILSNTDLE